jgi:hypothetical protein
MVIPIMSLETVNDAWIRPTRLPDMTILDVYLMLMTNVYKMNITDEMETETTARKRMVVLIIMRGIEIGEEIIGIVGITTGTMLTENKSAIAIPLETAESASEIIEPEMIDLKWIEAMTNEGEIVEEEVLVGETEVKVGAFAIIINSIIIIAV